MRHGTNSAVLTRAVPAAIRKRSYDAAAGRFTSMDPYAGNNATPLSLHKYSYAHSDPINNKDPTGMFVGGLAGMLVGLAVGYKMRGYKTSADMAAGTQVFSAFMRWGVPILSGTAIFLASAGVASWYWGSKPLWTVNGSLPSHEDNVSNQNWANNVATAMKNYVDNYPGIGEAQKAAAKTDADKISVAYVTAVRTRAVDIFSLTGSDEVMFGSGGNWPDWVGNAFDGRRKCGEWTTAMTQSLSGMPNSFWQLKNHWNVPIAGDVSLGLLFQHNFVSVTFDPEGQFNNAPSFILDPWKRARPDIFDFNQFNGLWPIQSAEVSGTID